MAHLLGAERLHLEFPTRVVFDEVTLGIDEGDRVGVVGRNGDGKSTLLKLLSGRMEPDAGRVTLRRGVRIGMLDQADVVDPGKTVAESVVGGILELGEAHGALAGLVSGSGPTVAFLVDDAESAIELQVALSAARLNAVHVHGPVHGARIIHG